MQDARWEGDVGVLEQYVEEPDRAQRSRHGRIRPAVGVFMHGSG